MVIDHSITLAMEKMAVSKFKATCLAVLEKVNATGMSVTITKFGKPLAEIIPVSIPSSNAWLGSGMGTARIAGDILEPAGGLDADAIVREWDDVHPAPRGRGRAPKPRTKAR
jgi:prevent-host-death family protein